MDDPAYRYLRGYALDPGFSTRLHTSGINEVVYRIPFESLQPGPIGDYVEVIDFDPASDCWYEPLDLRDERVASQQGMEPGEGNPQFHQQLVYAVAMKTIRHFERALGRKVLWHPRWIKRPPAKQPGPARSGSPWMPQYVQRLRIYPHAVRDANAYYDPDRRALLFGYFAAADQFQGGNYPGGLVFTCLSPDIVAHEISHAILDALHHHYLEDTNPDVAGFHEGFADIVALLQRFTFRQLVEHQLYASGGRMDRYTVLGELATQFGEALAGNRGALRSMIGHLNEKGEWVALTPDPSDYARHGEAHERGALLVATVFDAFQRIYNYRTRDLLRIATNGTGVLPEGSISRDLVHRLGGEASDIAEHLLHICIRALDYCPPNDITFGSYLRALITADLDIAPEDESGYRVALIEAFRARGIFPERVNTLSVSSLRWSKFQFTLEQQRTLDQIARKLKDGIRLMVETTDRRLLHEYSTLCHDQLHKLFEEEKANDAAKWEDFLNQLGMTAMPVSQLFPLGSNERFLLDGQRNEEYVPPIEVRTVRPAFRTGREARQVEQVVITLTQKVTVDIGDEGTVKEMVFRGGCSLIMRLGELNSVEHAIVKNIKSYNRFCDQKTYLRGEAEGARPASSSLYADDDREPRLSFNLLHRPRI